MLSCYGARWDEKVEVNFNAKPQWRCVAHLRGLDSALIGKWKVLLWSSERGDSNGILGFQIWSLLVELTALLFVSLLTSAQDYARHLGGLYCALWFDDSKKSHDQSQCHVIWVLVQAQSRDTVGLVCSCWYHIEFIQPHQTVADDVNLVKLKFFWIFWILLFPYIPRFVQVRSGYNMDIYGLAEMYNTGFRDGLEVMWDRSNVLGWCILKAAVQRSIQLLSVSVPSTYSELY